MNGTKIKEPLFHISRRSVIARWKAWMIRIIAILLSLIVCGVIVFALTKLNPVKVYGTMWEGAFGSNRKTWNTIRDAMLLLCTGVALAPAFKMRFWNIGAEGQILVGGIATAACMIYWGNTLPTWLLLIIMVVVSMIAGALWGIIPAIFQARWNTNETLFTLMMNYVAIQLVSYFLKTFVKTGSGVLSPMPQFGLPVLFGHQYLLNIIIVAVLTVVVYIYLKYTKQGYEIAVVGESENTANYIGINVKKVVIRTLIVSGALCGIAGLLLVGGTNHTINTETAGGRGFTAIMVSWLAKFNPIFMVFTSFLIVFLQKGSQQVSTDFRLPQAISDIVTGIILFFIIGCEFFLNYKIVVSKNGKENA